MMRIAQPLLSFLAKERRFAFNNVILAYLPKILNDGVLNLVRRSIQLNANRQD